MKTFKTIYAESARTKPPTTNNIPYPDRARMNPPTTNADEEMNITPSIEELLTRQTLKIDTLIQQIGSLIGLIMMLIEKKT